MASPISMRFGNCLVWVLVQRIFIGGEIKIAPRKDWWLYLWPHFQWYDGHATWQYSPRARVGDGQGIDTLIFFEGIHHRIFRRTP